MSGQGIQRTYWLFVKDLGKVSGQHNIPVIWYVSHMSKLMWTKNFHLVWVEYYMGKGFMTKLSVFEIHGTSTMIMWRCRWQSRSHLITYVKWTDTLGLHELLTVIMWWWRSQRLLMSNELIPSWSFIRPGQVIMIIRELMSNELLWSVNLNAYLLTINLPFGLAG